MKTVFIVEDPLHYFSTQSFEMREWAEQYESKLAAIEEQTKSFLALQDEIAEKIKRTTEWLRDYGSTT